jgi:PPOX class probable F420-dependent enzyme
MATFDPQNPGEEVLAFLGEYHLATLTIVKEDGSPHVTAVGFTYEPGSSIARVITWADAWKARHVDARAIVPAAICTVDAGRWLTFSGNASVTDDPERVAEGVRRYAERYRTPGERDDRVVIELAVDKIVGRA